MKFPKCQQHHGHWFFCFQGKVPAFNLHFHLFAFWWRPQMFGHRQQKLRYCWTWKNHSNLVFFPMYLFPNGRYTDCLSSPFVTNKGEILKLHYKYYSKRKKKNIKEQKKTFKANIKVLMISSSHKDNNRKGTKSVFHHFCPVLPVSFTLCPIR